MGYRNRTMRASLPTGWTPKPMPLALEGPDSAVCHLKALQIGAGDEVILPGYTCVVVPSAVLFAGATPVYVDILPGTYSRILKKFVMPLPPHPRHPPPAIPTASRPRFPRFWPWLRAEGFEVIETAPMLWGLPWMDAHWGCLAMPLFLAPNGRSPIRPASAASLLPAGRSGAEII